VNPADGGVELFEGHGQGTRQRVAVRLEDRDVRSEDTQIELAVEERDSLPIRGEAVPVRVRLPLDQATQAEAAKVVCHLRGGIGAAQQRGDARSEVAMAKAGWQMDETRQGLHEGLDAGITEAHGGDPVPVELPRILQAVERLGRQGAVMTDAFSGQEGAIDVIPQGPQCRQLVEAFGEAEVVRVVDRQLAAQAVAFFEVLLQMGMFVFDVETRLDAVRDDARAIAAGRSGRPTRESTWKEQPDPIGAAEVEVVANDGLEEVAALHRTVKDLRETDFELTQGDAVIVAGSSVLRAQRPGQAVGPPVKELLQILGPELITQGLQPGGIGAREEAVVETGERDPGAAQLLFHPLVPVQADLDGIRHIRPNFEERRAPVQILDIEVVMVDGHRLAREVEGDAAPRQAALVGFECSHLLLGHSNEDDALVAREGGPMRGGEGIFVLARFEHDERHGVIRGERLDRGDKAIVHRTEQRRRGNRMSEMVAQKIAEPAGRLQLGHVPLQIDAIKTAHGEGDVILDNGLDVGRHQILLGRKIDDGTPREHTDDCIGPNIISEASPQTAQPSVFDLITGRFEAKLH